MASQHKRRQSGVSIRVSDRARSTARNQSEPLLSRRSILQFFAFAIFFCAAVLIALFDRDFTGPQVVEGQIADRRIVADFPFTYESRLATAARAAEVRERVPPVYTASRQPFTDFEQFATRLDVEFSQIESQVRAIESRDERIAAIRRFVDSFLAKAAFQPDPRSLTDFLANTSSLERNRYLRLGLGALRRIYLNGIVDPSDPNFRDTGSYQMIRIQNDSGEITTIELQRRLDALVSLRLDLLGLEIPEPLFNPLFRFLETGVRENLNYDPARSRAEEEAAVASVQPVRFSVTEAETLVTPGAPVSPRDYERYTAYLREIERREEGRLLIDSEQEKRAFQALLVLFAFAIFVNAALPDIANHPGRLALVLLLILVNIALIRLTMNFEDANFFETHPSLLPTLRFGAPVAFAPILLTILLRPNVALGAAFVIAFFFGLIHGNTVPVFLVALVATLIGVQSCKEVRLRTNVIRACVGTGAAVAVLLFVEGLLGDIPVDVLGRGAVLALAIGFLTGVGILGVLPFLERAFKITTDITLLEYTDYNHPLLRQMQLEAPGTYHHSLMVASLSENAATAIGANGLLCRATCLFHDIGKLVKPEYFIENQSGANNPLIEKNPSISALIIKSHVKEGVAIARRYHLPEIFVDIIEQHHGTSLIAYFYHQARKRSAEGGEARARNPQGGAGLDEPTRIDESTYRYDGPKPQSVESAIILIADSIEAASRSLSKINAQSVNELIEKIIGGKLDDGQFDECGITTQHLARIRATLSRTLLNSLHSRIRYPDDDKPDNDPKSTKPPPIQEQNGPESATS